jgi:hypothetical protein
MTRYARNAGLTLAEKTSVPGNGRNGSGLRDRSPTSTGPGNWPDQDLAWRLKAPAADQVAQRETLALGRLAGRRKNCCVGSACTSSGTIRYPKAA